MVEPVLGVAKMEMERVGMKREMAEKVDGNRNRDKEGWKEKVRAQGSIAPKEVPRLMGLNVVLPKLEQKNPVP